MTRQKIKSLDDLERICNKLREENKTIVHCHGTFDLLHPGHINLFEQARSLGDVLVVTVTPDIHIKKGFGRPVYTEKIRIESIASLVHVDFVALDYNSEACEIIRLVKPHFYVKSEEFAGTENDETLPLGREKKVLDEIGGRIHFGKETLPFHSSYLINRYFSNHSPETQTFLENFQHKYSFNDIKKILERISKLKVLVVGDTILDIYKYSSLLGKPSRDSIQKVRTQKSEAFAGGAVAVANNIVNFCSNVGLISVLGKRDGKKDLFREQFIKQKINPQISSNFFYRNDAPTFTNIRYADPQNLERNFFGVCHAAEELMDNNLSKSIADKIREVAPEYDLVLVTDFGAGLCTPEVVKALEDSSKFLAVNAQLNAANEGFNSITKYSRADYISQSEKELRLAFQERYLPLEKLLERATKHFNLKSVSITRGKNGALLWGLGEFHHVPSFKVNVVDSTGAGDAYIAITAPVASLLDVPLELVGFLGNIAGGLACKIVGHRESITKDLFTRHAQTLMK